MQKKQQQQQNPKSYASIFLINVHAKQNKTKNFKTTSKQIQQYSKRTSEYNQVASLLECYQGELIYENLSVMHITLKMKRNTHGIISIASEKVALR